MNHSLFRPDVAIDLTIKAIGVIVAIIGAIVAIREYKKKQAWTKSEFLAKEIKYFFDDFDVKRALWMLDWHAFTIPLAQEEMGYRTSFEFDNNLLLTSLSDHNVRFKGKQFPDEDEEYTPEETQIRVIFDSFFQKLGGFQTHIDNGLFTYGDLEHYVAYYVKIIHGKDNRWKTQNIQNQIMDYIIVYKYIQVKRLIDYYCKEDNSLNKPTGE